MAAGIIAAPMDAQEEQIAFHQAESLRLKSLFNQHSLFNTKLPPEILMLVFLESARSFHDRCLEPWCGDRAERVGDPAHKPLYRWIRVSQVCKHWRKVALDCAELWAILVLDERIDPEWYKVILERSCGLPLTIILHATHNGFCCSGRCQPEAVRTSNYAKAMDVFRSVFVNARTLSVFIDSEDHAEVWEVLRGLKRAERLQLLRIKAYSSISFDHPGNVSAIGDLIAPPSLRSAEISGTVFRWSNTLLGPSIRHLNLSNHYFKVLPSIDEMLSALQRMQQLETLVLDQAPSEDSLPEGYTRRVTLPCLHWLRIPLESPASSTLIPFLQLPPTTLVDFCRGPRRIVFRDEERMPDSRTIAALAKAAVSLLKDLAVYAIDESEFSFQNPPLCKFWACPPHDVNTSASWPWRDIVAAPYRLQFRASMRDPAMTAVLAAIDLRRVHTLSIWENNCDRVRPLLESVRGAENLATLRLTQEICLPIGAILAGWRRPPSMDADDPPSDRRYYDKVPDWYGYGNPGDGDRILDAQNTDDGDLASGTSDRGDATSARIEPLFPRLRTLHLSEFDFPVTAKRARSYFRFYRPMAWYECRRNIEYGLDVLGLVKAMQTRVARGAEELVSVEFEDCQCREKERLVPLVEIVPEVWLEGKRVSMEELGSMDV